MQSDSRSGRREARKHNFIFFSREIIRGSAGRSGAKGFFQVTMFSKNFSSCGNICITSVCRFVISVSRCACYSLRSFTPSGGRAPSIPLTSWPFPIVQPLDNFPMRQSPFSLAVLCAFTLRTDRNRLISGDQITFCRLFVYRRRKEKTFLHTEWVEGPLRSKYVDQSLFVFLWRSHE